MKRYLLLLVLIAVALLLQSAPQATASFQATYVPESQSPEIFALEARTVYLGNLERRKNGLPPLRWNRELTLAARWFAWDSIENRPAGWIGHEDTLGGNAGARGLRFGYLGGTTGENAAWTSGLASAEGLIQMWMNSAGHRQNLLSAGHTEIGFGAYARGGSEATYAVQHFGVDAALPPVIIENEAPNTTRAQVTLYQHSPAGSGSLTGMGQAQEIMLSTDACFGGASWQRYDRAEYSFNLPGSEGWKTVYARIRDRLGRTSTTSDAIYLGASPSASGYNLNQLSQTTSSVKLYGLNGRGLTRAQFSLGWAADNTDPTFKLNWGSGETVSDSAAAGKSAFRMYGSGETMVWTNSYGFLPGAGNYVAYFRLKTSSNAGTAQVARVEVEANGNSYARALNANQFSAAGQYQEFAVPFRYDGGASNPWLIFKIWRSGSAEIVFDTATIFTAPQSFSATQTWNVPGGKYRGQGVWVRYSSEDGSVFSDYQTAATAPALSASPSLVNLVAELNRSSSSGTVQVSAGCGGGWSIAKKPSWLNVSTSGDQLVVSGQTSTPGSYSGDVVLQSASGETATITANLVVAANLPYRTYVANVGR